MYNVHVSLKVVNLLISFFVVSLVSVSAETEVNLEYLIEAAIQQHPDLELSRGILKAGQINESNLPWWDSPELRVGYGRDTNVSGLSQSDTYPDHEYEAAFRVFPKNPWKRKAEGRKLRAENHLFELSYEERQRQISGKVQELYWEACYTSAELELKQQLLEIYQGQVGRLEALLEGGQMTLGQSLPVKMKRLDVEMEADLLKRAYDDLCAGLRAVCGVDLDLMGFARPTVLTSASFDLAYDTWRRLALDGRTDVKRYELLVENSKAELDTVKANQIPWIKHVQANYRVRNDYGDQDSAGLQIAINLPFLASDGGEKRMASSMLDAHRRQSFQARRMAEFEVEGLIAEFQALERQWKAQERQITAMQKELSNALDKMEAQGRQANQSYWDARVTLLELDLKELKLSRSFQQLLLKAKAVLGEGEF